MFLFCCFPSCVTFFLGGEKTVVIVLSVATCVFRSFFSHLHFLVFLPPPCLSPVASEALVLSFRNH